LIQHEIILEYINANTGKTYQILEIGLLYFLHIHHGITLSSAVTYLWWNLKSYQVN